MNFYHCSIEFLLNGINDGERPLWMRFIDNFYPALVFSLRPQNSTVIVG